MIGRVSSLVGVTAGVVAVAVIRRINDYLCNGPALARDRVECCGFQGCQRCGLQNMHYMHMKNQSTLHAYEESVDATPER